jgi:hypothetical protein
MASLFSRRKDDPMAKLQAKLSALQKKEGKEYVDLVRFYMKNHKLALQGAKEAARKAHDQGYRA